MEKPQNCIGTETCHELEGTRKLKPNIASQASFPRLSELVVCESHAPLDNPAIRNQNLEGPCLLPTARMLYRSAGERRLVRGQKPGGLASRGPEGFGRGDKFDGDLLNKQAQPFCAILHPRLLGHDVTQKNQCLLAAGRDHVLCVFD